MSSPLNFQPPGAFITHLTKAGFRRHGPATTVDDFEVTNLDLTSLNLDVGILVPFLVSKRLSAHQTVKQEQLEEVLPDLDNVTKSLGRRKLTILTVGGKLMHLDRSIMDDLRVLNVAIIDRSTIETIYSTDDPGTKAKAICAVLVNFIGRESLSPYVSGRPAIGGRFFGRSSLLKDLVPSSGNFTIIGNRRIGKTSLLKEIKERLKLRNVRTGEIYGATCSSTADVVYKLLQALGKYREAEHVLTDPKRAKNLASYVKTVPDAEKPEVAVFIDELDGILEFDAKQNYEVMHLLRETFEGNSSCRVFLAGFRKVMEVARSMNAPPFNFTRPIELPLFSRDETYGMVTRPLERLGIEVANTDLPTDIYRETAGHPELIQIHCSSIVRYFQTHQKVPAGTDLLTDVFDTAEYKQKVLGAFLANTNTHEALLCFLLMKDADEDAHPGEYEFGPKDVDRVLTTAGIGFEISQISNIITHLKVSGIIKKVPGISDNYQFSAPQLVNYCIGMDLKFCITKQLELLKEGEQAGRTLASAPLNREDEPSVFSF